MSPYDLQPWAKPVSYIAAELQKGKLFNTENESLDRSL